MVSTPPEEVEVLYYDPEFRRRHLLETHVPTLGEVVGGNEEFVVSNVKWGNGRFRGLRMIYVYLSHKDR